MQWLFQTIQRNNISKHHLPMKYSFDNMIRIFFSICLFIAFLFTLMYPLNAISQGNTETLTNKEENHYCLECHGSPYYYFYNDWTEEMQKEKMNPYHIIDTTAYYLSNHKSFRCIDCHSYDYETFPHDWGLRMEYKYTCMDCHEGDEDYAQFNFERIREEYTESVHHQMLDSDFSCWDCHDPHSYRIIMRSDNEISKVISYANSICLECHANSKNYSFLTDEKKPDIIEKHDWLPNQKAHFLNVRCIECHAQQEEDILVAHNIQNGEKAVKKCVECHSSNSLLMTSLYKYKVKENRRKNGLINATILEESFVIGANRNYYLNLVSIIVFSLVILGITIHATLRIIKK